MINSRTAGFTLVEMLVTMVLGVLFIGTLYHLYIVTINSSAEANRDAKASSIGYQLLRNKATSVTNSPCVPHESPHDVGREGINIDGLPTPVTATITTDCPYASTPQINRITVTVRYGQGRNQSEVRHAILGSK